MGPDAEQIIPPSKWPMLPGKNGGVGRVYAPPPPNIAPRASCVTTWGIMVPIPDREIARQEVRAKKRARESPGPARTTIVRTDAASVLLRPCGTRYARTPAP